MVFKFVRLVKPRSPLEVTVEDRSTEITAEEMKEAEIYWYHKVQQESFREECYRLQNKERLPSNSSLNKLAPFFDDSNNLIRVGGRLQFANLPEETSTK